MSGPILCGVDGSEGGWRALDEACSAALARKARLVFVCVVPSGDFPEEMEEFARMEHSAEHADSLLFDMVARGVLADAKRRAERAGVADAEYVARRGEAADEICELAGNLRAAEIVVGRRRRHWAALALLGSVSAKLAAEAPCPVTIAPI
jgi:nucleotide-binding universal stress UspA family protein